MMIMMISVVVVVVVVVMVMGMMMININLLTRILAGNIMYLIPAAIYSFKFQLSYLFKYKIYLWYTGSVKFNFAVSKQTSVITRCSTSPQRLFTMYYSGCNAKRRRGRRQVLD
jgi:hypothetical protein